jgi:ATP-dependent Clp protease, protease subunit
MRRIVISGDIDSETYFQFTTELAEYENESDNDVELELNSTGGCAEDALAFTGRMRTSKCRINVIVSGACYSAAVILLASGETRRMTRESWVMVHEEQGESTGSVANREKDIAHYRRLENQWNYLMEFYTATKAEKWAELHKAETYLSADQCLELGLVDKVI